MKMEQKYTKMTNNKYYITLIRILKNNKCYNKLKEHATTYAEITGLRNLYYLITIINYIKTCDKINYNDNVEKDYSMYIKNDVKKYLIESVHKAIYNHQTILLKTRKHNILQELKIKMCSCVVNSINNNKINELTDTLRFDNVIRKTLRDLVTPDVANSITMSYIRELEKIKIKNYEINK